ncbi:putative quinol monooxygenase [Shimia sp.]|jgi:quinol monooxygenase YgiN|uniref:putative quinol monooxygenase n=1 Tax=unclassified Shimia TaxID=2630038 RepID=UPI0025E118F9|nr:antibiotic biosynthesis monooxygenase family protein [Shimia sp.]MCH2067474.1 antibiotic biosynthesis monooxygenase [Shimia sp.]
MRETVVVSFSTDERDADHVASALKTLAARACNMPGCISYAATTLADSPSEFHIQQKWDNAAAWQAYLNSEAHFAFQTEVYGLLSDLTVAKQAPLRPRRSTCFALAS